MMVFSDTIYVMLLTHDFYKAFTPQADRRCASHQPGAAVPVGRQPEGSTAMVEAAVAAGGKADPGPKQDYGRVMYGRSFEDPDGHIGK